MRRKFRLTSGNAIELTYVRGLGLITAWERKPPAAEDYAEYRSNRRRWINSVLPADRAFAVTEDRPGTLGRVVLLRRSAAQSAA